MAAERGGIAMSTFALPYVQSIQAISKVIPTNGSQPVEVLCSDMQDYICKYAYAPAKVLFREYLAHCFARIWELTTPPAAFVMIQDGHIQPQHISNRRLPGHFQIPCFGSQRLSNVMDLNDAFLSKSRTELRQINTTDFLEIALFDIWLANEDRTANNLNLLLYAPLDGLQRFVVIDHVAIFNWGSREGQSLTALTLEDSIIGAPHFKKLYPQSTKNRDAIRDVGENAYLCVEKCRAALPSILQWVPDAWKIDTKAFASWADKHLFDDSWKQEMYDTYLSHCQLAYSTTP